MTKLQANSLLDDFYSRNFYHIDERQTLVVISSFFLAFRQQKKKKFPG